MSDQDWADERAREFLRLLREVADSDPAHLDGTDGAHPAFWRGQDDGVAGAVRALLSEPDGYVSHPELQAIRTRIARLEAVAEAARRVVHDWHEVGEFNAVVYAIMRALEPPLTALGR